ncbi:signal recognition particle, SRP14 subunit [Coniella lustricola]|uniref:Signal recognition particle subunit SRP14 n=1 Tax=Coniella lustricola TaxID=2025994 RepID=A0A2T3A7Y1_9PEZI|nr:signal recognition particle, SRP14 subunit [Coniella lustricola]
MAEIRLSHDEFFNKLGELFTSSKGKDTGSIYLSQKRCMASLLSPRYPIALRSTGRFSRPMACEEHNPFIRAAQPSYHSAKPLAPFLVSQDRPIPSKEDPLADIAATLSSSDESPAATYPVLVRATNGKSGKARKAGQRVKLATVVDSDALDAFYVRYAEVCKAGMLALKPRDRSKRKTKTKGKKKKGAAA